MRTLLSSELTLLWFKDAVAGAGLIVFMASSFALASGLHQLFSQA